VPPPVSSAASAAVATADPAAAEQAIRQRSDAYYKALIAADRTTAREYVSPATLRFYDRSPSGTIATAKVQTIEFSPDGQTAKTRVAQTVRVPMINSFLDITQEDTWKLVNGQWYIEAQDAYTMETPFGKLQGPPDPAEVQKV